MFDWGCTNLNQLTWKNIELAMHMSLTNDFNAGSCVWGLLKTSVAAFLINVGMGIGAGGFDGVERNTNSLTTRPVVSRFAFVPKNLQQRLIAGLKKTDTLAIRPASSGLAEKFRAAQARQFAIPKLRLMNAGATHLQRRVPGHSMNVGGPVIALSSQRKGQRRLRARRFQGHVIGKSQLRLASKKSTLFDEAPEWALRAFRGGNP